MLRRPFPLIPVNCEMGKEVREMQWKVGNKMEGIIGSRMLLFDADLEVPKLNNVAAARSESISNREIGRASCRERV